MLVNWLLLTQAIDSPTSVRLGRERDSIELLTKEMEFSTISREGSSIIPASRKVMFLARSRLGKIASTPGLLNSMERISVMLTS